MPSPPPEPPPATAPSTTPAPAHARWEGPRGEGWVVAQSVLLLGYLAVPRPGGAWPAPVRGTAAALGGPALLGGGLLFGAGCLALGRHLTPLPHPPPDGRLVEDGPYRLVRHPIYSGLCLGALGLALLTAHPVRLVAALVLYAFFDAKARREEVWLAARFPAYPAYRRRVRKLIPWLY